MNQIFFKPGEEKLFDTFKYSVLDMAPQSLPIGIHAAAHGQYIYYNTEQMSRKNELAKVSQIITATKPVEVWDYSEANATILRSLGFTVKVVPLKSPQWYIDKIKAWKSDEYDVGFCGTPNQRRSDIFEKLRSRGLKVNVVVGHGDYRDQELAKCKIIINVHYTEEYMIFEQLRCEPFLQAGFLVISEHSWDDDPRCINVPYEKLVDEVISRL